jgi:hypothetical protein
MHQSRSKGLDLTLQLLLIDNERCVSICQMFIAFGQYSLEQSNVYDLALDASLSKDIVKTLHRFLLETNRNVSKTSSVLHCTAILHILGRALGLCTELDVLAMQTGYR